MFRPVSVSKLPVPKLPLVEPVYPDPMPFRVSPRVNIAWAGDLMLHFVPAPSPFTQEAQDLGLAKGCKRNGADHWIMWSMIVIKNPMMQSTTAIQELVFHDSSFCVAAMMTNNMFSSVKLQQVVRHHIPTYWSYWHSQHVQCSSLLCSCPLNSWEYMH